MISTINPDELSIPRRHHLLLSAVGPRPIAFVSTINNEGTPNLSPYSFFNLFSTNPPVGAFSVALRGHDGSPKDTLLNLQEVPELTVNIVNHSMVEQQNLASHEFDRGVNEFDKSGLTMVQSQTVKPPYVMESPVSFEASLRDIISFGTTGPAGNMVLFDIKLIHVQQKYLDSDNRLDCTKIDLVGRMGGNWYCHASGSALFEVSKPNREVAIGIDRLPTDIRESHILSANDLGKLGCALHVPDQNTIESFNFEASDYSSTEILHKEIKTLISGKQMKKAIALAFWNQ